MYSAERLYCRRHGTIDAANIDSVSGLLLLQDIPTTVISASAHSDIVSKNDLHATFNNSAHLQALDRHIVGGRQSFHYQLCTHLLERARFKDKVRMGETVNSELGCINYRILGGYGRVQPQGKCKDERFVNGIQLPSLDVQPLLLLPDSLRENLFKLFKSATVFVQKTNTHAFSSNKRNDFFARHMNAKCGFPYSKQLFEYYDIVITRNTAIPGHIDPMDDHRTGYDCCAVYSFYQIINGMSYRVSVILATRYSVGACYDQIITNDNNK